MERVKTNRNNTHTKNMLIFYPSNPEGRQIQFQRYTKQTMEGLCLVVLLFSVEKRTAYSLSIHLKQTYFLRQFGMTVSGRDTDTELCSRRLPGWSSLQHSSHHRSEPPTTGTYGLCCPGLLCIHSLIIIQALLPQTIYK